MPVNFVPMFNTKTKSLGVSYFLGDKRSIENQLDKI